MIATLGRRLAMFLPFSLPLLLLPQAPLFHFTGILWAFAALLYLYGVAPLFDLVSGRKKSVSTQKPEAWFEDAVEYVMLPRLLMLVLVIIKLRVIISVAGPGFSTIDIIGCGLLTGQMLGAYSVVVAHELVHRRSLLDRLLGEALLVTISYPHFTIEHVLGHHKYAATPKDPASANFGETVYAFFLRALVGSVVQAWQIEITRLTRRGLKWFSYRNRMLRYAIEVSGLYFALYFWLGAVGPAMLLMQSLVAMFSLRVVDYVQHYGLRRREISPGVYERFGIQHAWNSAHRFSNAYWLSLPRHSDHHCAGSKNFHLLQDFEELGAPQWPGGLPLMFLTALVPPIWFRVMNPRVEEWRRVYMVDNYCTEHIYSTRANTAMALAKLKASYEEGRISIELTNIPLTIRYALLPSMIDRHGGVLLISGLFIFNLAELFLRSPWGFVTLLGTCALVIIADCAHLMFTSARIVLSTAMLDPQRWERLWNEATVEVVAKSGSPKGRLCSPIDNWRQVAI